MTVRLMIADFSLIFTTKKNSRKGRLYREVPQDASISKGVDGLFWMADLQNFGNLKETTKEQC